MQKNQPGTSAGQSTPAPGTPPEVPKTEAPKTPAEAPKTEAPKPGEQQKTPEAGDPPKDNGNEQLGEGGLKALQAEREARKALEKQMAALAPLQKIAEALGQGDPEKGKSEIEQLTERLSQHEKTLAEERQARWRAEVAHAHGFTAEQAAELRGETREELTAHAQRLQSLFPQARTPKPDPRQGGSSGASTGIDARIQEAQSKGDWRAVISLQNQKLIEQQQ